MVGVGPPATVALVDWLQVAAAVGSLLSGLGLLGTAATVLILIRQTRAVQQANVASAYQSIIGISTSMNALLLEHPEILQTLKDAALTLERFDFEEEMRQRPQAAMVTVQQLDFFELVLVTMAAFPPSLQAEWQDYIRGMLARNPYMRRACLDTDWYTEELRALAMEAA